MRDNTDRRAFKRRRLVYSLKVVDAKNKRELGRIGDLNNTGLMLLCKGELPLDTSYEVQIDLSDIRDLKRNGPLSLEVKTLWTNQEQHPQFTCVGTQITDLPKSNRVLVSKVIDHLGFNK